jgi:hypothetical protein
MSEAVRAYWSLQADAQRDRERSIRIMKSLRFAWTENIRTLYKFFTMDKKRKNYVRDLIVNSRIYFSSPDHFNDPLDCAPVLKWAKDPADPEFLGEIMADEARLMRESGDSPKEIVRKRTATGVPVERVGQEATRTTREYLRSKTFIYCLTARRDNPLLWSHYAAGHTGVCLHFGCRPGTLFGLARKVHYRRDRHPILMPLRYNRPQRRIIEAMVFRKAHDWRYEHEYRIVYGDPGKFGFALDGRYCSFPPSLLLGITLGMKISRENRANIQKCAATHSPALPVYEAAEDESTFAIDSFRVR